MDSCHLDAPLIKTVFGIEIESIDLQEVFDRAKAISDLKVKQIRQDLDRALNNLPDLDQVALNGTLRVYQVLSDLAQEKDLSGLAVRCWPEFFTQMGCAACGAMSMLSDGFRGQTPIPCGCEADINGTITQLILQKLSGQPAFGTDMVGIDEKEELIALWHCGLAPLSMADTSTPPQGTIHSNRKLPLLMDFQLKTGGVTFARLSRAGGKLRMVIGSGEMVEGPKPFGGTSGLLKPIMSTRAFLEVLMKEGLEHHISLTYGNFSAELKAIAGVFDLPTLWMDSKEVPL
jgi:L-fucose isomerase-like protein